MSLRVVPLQQAQLSSQLQQTKGPMAKVCWTDQRAMIHPKLLESQLSCEQSKLGGLDLDRLVTSNQGSVLPGGPALEAQCSFVLKSKPSRNDVLFCFVFPMALGIIGSLFSKN